MEWVKIGKDNYVFEKDYRDDNKLRESFNELTQNTYGFDFEEWYKSGYWNEKYIPYSIIDKDRVVANVSVNIVYFNMFGQEKMCIQIGTVMTDTEYRGRGLSRFLLERAIEAWKDKCGMIYLFANDSVLDFYPKFGFEKEQEYISYKYINKELNNAAIQKPSYKKLDMNNRNDRDFLYKKIMSSSVNSKLAMINGADLAMFYCISFMKENIFYFEDIDTVVIAEADGEKLFIHEVYCDGEVCLDNIIQRLMEKNINKVMIGFTPKYTSSYESELYHEDDTTLFVLGGSNIFRENKIKFEPLSHA